MSEGWYNHPNPATTPWGEDKPPSGHQIIQKNWHGVLTHDEYHPWALTYDEDNAFLKGNRGKGKFFPKGKEGKGKKGGNGNPIPWSWLRSWARGKGKGKTQRAKKRKGAPSSSSSTDWDAHTV